MEKSRTRYLAAATLFLVIVTPVMQGRLPESMQDPKSNFGLALGFLSMALIFFAGFYSVRRARLWLKWGTLKPWLALHTYLGILALLIVFLHADWRFRPGAATAALVLLILVTISGMVGWAIYLLVPARISSLSQEIITPEETYFKMDRIQERIDKIERRVEKRKDRKTEEEEREVRELEENLAVLMKELKTEFRQEAYLGTWLYVHIPLSAALIVVASVHAIMMFYL